MFVTPNFDVGTYTKVKKPVFRIFIYNLPMGNSCFVNSLFYTNEVIICNLDMVQGNSHNSVNNGATDLSQYSMDSYDHWLSFEH